MGAAEERDQGFYGRASAWKNGGGEAFALAELYKVYSDNSKTERECAAFSAAAALGAGYRDLDGIVSSGERILPGDRVLKNVGGKALILFVAGRRPLDEGANMTAAHIDAPRLDLKAVPLYEKGGMALLKTHYYGGVKKYQWLCTPLALHGVAWTDGSEKRVLTVGEDPQDPVFFIADLLPHLAGDQMQKKASEAVTGEQLNIISGSVPSQDAPSKKVKDAVLRILASKHQLSEKSFLTAEIEAVPAAKARDVGFDAGMVAAYAHDDRCCAFAALEALLRLEGVPERTCVCILADKEEVGSVGATGLAGRFFENAFAEFYAACLGDFSEIGLRRALASSRCLSMDVTAGFDPSFADAYEEANSALMGHGAALMKYTGVRGKSGSSDASSEFMRFVTDLFDEAGVVYQTGELGKVDQGGGGTVALTIAAYGADVIDFGVPVLSMHAPCELISKADLFAAFEGAGAFYKSV